MTGLRCSALRAGLVGWAGAGLGWVWVYRFVHIRAPLSESEAPESADKELAVL